MTFLEFDLDSQKWKVLTHKSLPFKNFNSKRVRISPGSQTPCETGLPCSAYTCISGAAL